MHLFFSVNGLAAPENGDQPNPRSDTHSHTHTHRERERETSFYVLMEWTGRSEQNTGTQRGREKRRRSQVEIKCILLQ